MTGLAERPAAAASPSGLAAEIPAGRGLGWWGMAMFIATEATFVAVLLGSYFYLRFQYPGPWPPPPAGVPGLTRAAVMTALVLPTAGTTLLAGRAARGGRAWPAAAYLVATVALGAGSLVAQGFELAASARDFTPATSVYGSLYYLIHGVDGAHVLIGLAITGSPLVTASRGALGPERADHVRIVAMYWYFLAAVWIGVLLTLYLAPRI